SRDPYFGKLTARSHLLLSYFSCFPFAFDHDTHHGPKGIFWSCELETTDGLSDNKLAFV
ncbi:hypothetical protein GALMADRAFT_253052, partial [Galerina marginata CBS 339.88]